MTEVIPFNDRQMDERYPNTPQVIISSVVKIETFKRGNVYLSISSRRMYSPLYSSGHVYGSFKEEDFVYNMATIEILYKIINDLKEIDRNTLQDQLLLRIWRDDLLEVITANTDLHLELDNKKEFYECKISWFYNSDQNVDSLETLVIVSETIKDLITDSIDGEPLYHNISSF